MNRPWSCGILLGCLLMLSHLSVAQQTTRVIGRVLNAKTGEPLPFVNVYFSGTTEGTSTDFEGHFALETDLQVSAVIAQFLGYKTEVQPIIPGALNELEFFLEGESIQLEEIVVVPGENPAFRILRKVWENKEKNDPARLTGFQFENYNKVQVSVLNFKKQLHRVPVFRPFKGLFREVEEIQTDSFNSIMPLMLTETISDFYYRVEPESYKEVIKASKITGVAISEDSWVGQVMGAYFQFYNLYDDWLNLVGKNFISPVAKGGKGYYHYILNDSVLVDGHRCYEIIVRPKRKRDLAFWGTIWIEDETYAMKQVSLEIRKEANLNWIRKMKVQQKFEKTSAGAWLPVKSRVLMHVKEVDRSDGLLLHFYTSSRDVQVNQPKALSFFESSFEVGDRTYIRDEAYWESKRHEKISDDEKAALAKINELKDIPGLKRVIKTGYFLINGYLELGGGIEIGPYIRAYRQNPVEGHRFRLGFRTHPDFSKKFAFQGYGAYGTLDHRWKYSITGRWILSRSPWTVLGAQRREDVDQWTVTDNIDAKDNLFTATSAIAATDNLNFSRDTRVWIEHAWSDAWSTTLMLQNRQFDPFFSFGYLHPGSGPGNGQVLNRFSTTEWVLENRIEPQGKYIFKRNRRVNIDMTGDNPAFILRYHLGVKDFIQGDFNYHKLQFQHTNKLRLGWLGTTNMNLTSGTVLGNVPYPLLNIHPGNETFFSHPDHFELMDFLEFISESYVALKLEHHFEGLITNRLPLINLLRLRTLCFVNGAYGTVSEDNSVALDDQGAPVRQFTSLEKKPYLEAGFGVENIFNFIRIDAVYRLTYSDEKYRMEHPDIRKWGIKMRIGFGF